MGKTISTQKIDSLRWIILLLQILVGTATAYIWCLTVYIGPFAESYGWDPAIVVLAFTGMMLFGIPGSIVGGKLRDRFGTKWVLKVGGIGFGLSVVASAFSTSAWMYVILDGCLASFFMYLVYVAQLANIGELFPDKRGLSYGFVAGGIAVGGAAIVPLAEWLTRVMSISGGIILQGIIYGAFVFIAGCLVFEAPKNYAPKGWTDPNAELAETDEDAVIALDSRISKLFTSPIFYLLFLTCFLSSPLYSALGSNLSSVAQAALGVDTATGAWMYSLWSIMAGAGGIIIGFISDKFFGPLRTYVYSIVICAVIAVLLFAFGADTYILFMLAIIFIGIVSGAFTAMLPNIIMSIYGSKNFGVNYGIFMCAGMIASVVGSQVSVRFTPTQLFGVGGIGFVAAIVIGFITMAVINKKFKRKAV